MPDVRYELGAGAAARTAGLVAVGALGLVAVVAAMLAAGLLLWNPTAVRRWRERRALDHMLRGVR